VKESALEITKSFLDLMGEIQPSLKEHAERVADNCAGFCEGGRLTTPDEVHRLYFAALLHDLGQVTTLAGISTDTDSLSEEENVLIKKHPVVGEKILANIACFEGLLSTIRHHHEHYDGSGYPDFLKGKDIPLPARILSLFNSFDAMCHPRFSREAMKMDDALQEIKRCAGTQFDPELIDPFVRYVEATAGVSDNFLLKTEKSFLKEVFTEILQRFKDGKIAPPVMPQVVQELQEVIKRASSNAGEVTAVIEKDPVIALRLISIANSPVYRGVQEIRNVRNALPRLGLKETLNIVIAIAHKSLYQAPARYKIMMDKLWVHSLSTAYATKLLARELKLEDPDYLFLMGLTHDIGKVLLLKAYSENIKIKTASLDAIMENIQEAHLSFGSLLLKRWGFDDAFIDVISHHEAVRNPSETAQDILVVYLANMMTRKLGASLFNGDHLELAELDAAVFLQLDAAKLAEVAEQVQSITQNIAHLF